MNDHEKQFECFVRDLVFDDRPDARHRDWLQQQLLPVWTRERFRRSQKGRYIMFSTKARTIAAALIAVVAISYITQWANNKSGSQAWWLGSSTAYGQEIAASLAKIEALVYRRQPVIVKPYGSNHISGNWDTVYKTRKQARIDTYYKATLVHTRWELPEGNDMIRSSVSYEYACYQVTTFPGQARNRDTVDDLMEYVKRLDKADRILETKEFEGKVCVGFEIRGGLNGNTESERVDRIWFDIETRLPVRIEEHGRAITNQPDMTITTIMDHFEYYAQVPIDMFDRVIPAEFVNAHPDTIRQERDRLKKGDMVYAQVPQELRDSIVAALKQVDTARFHKGSHTITTSRHAWCKDAYQGDQLAQTTWYVVSKSDDAPTSQDFNDDSYTLSVTHVDYHDQTYHIEQHTGDSHPGHPMDRILFLAGFVDRADRVLKDRLIEDRPCRGFELSAKKFSSSPNEVIHTLWFDSESLLPVRFEANYTNQPGTVITDRFEWNPALSDGVFTPVIPEGFNEIEASR